MTDNNAHTEASQLETRKTETTGGRPAISDAEGQAILERFLVGDQSALDEILKHYSPMIYGVFLRWFRLDLEDAEDLFQEVLLQLVVKAEQIRNLRPWLLGTAINQARKRIRRLVRDRKLADRVRQDLEPHTTAVDRGDEDLVRQALAQCSQADRELLRLTFFEELSYKELSLRLERPIGSIGPMRARALDRMRGIIEELERRPSVAA